MKIEPGRHCPLLDKTCIMQECVFWTQLRGTHPQTGVEMDEYDCAIKWLPILLVENAKENRQTAASVDSFRNEMVNTMPVFEVIAKALKNRDEQHVSPRDPVPIGVPTE